jgi:drug/metabolite transporter (DMT)-like permease
MAPRACQSHVFQALSSPILSTLLGILVLHKPFAFQTAIGATLVPGGMALTQRATGAT